MSRPTDAELAVMMLRHIEPERRRRMSAQEVADTVRFARAGLQLFEAVARENPRLSRSQASAVAMRLIREHWKPRA